MRCHLWTIIVMLVGSVMTPPCPGQVPKANPSSPAQTKTRPRAATGTASAKIEVVDSTPEDALRTFMLATMAHDEAALRVVTLPNPDLDWLLKGQVVPPDAVKEASVFIAKLPIRRMKAGDRFTMPKGKTYAVPASQVGEDKAVLLPEGAPIPTRLQKVKGHWKVEADPIIAGRKAADAARKKAEAKKATVKKSTSND